MAAVMPHHFSFQTTLLVRWEYFLIININLDVRPIKIPTYILSYVAVYFKSMYRSGLQNSPRNQNNRTCILRCRFWVWLQIYNCVGLNLSCIHFRTGLSQVQGQETKQEQEEENIGSLIMYELTLPSNNFLLCRYSYSATSPFLQLYVAINILHYIE